MAELVTLKHATSDQPNTSQDQRPSDGSTTSKTEESSAEGREAIKHSTDICTDTTTKDGFLDKGAGKRQLAWPRMVSFDAESFADEKQEYISKAIRVYKKRLLYKNIFLLSVAVLFVQTAFYSVADLRGVVLPSSEREWYIAEKSIYYFVVFLGLLFLTPCVTAKLGAKLAIAAGLSLYLAYTLFHVYIHPSTVLLGRVLVAFGTGILWTALGCYFAKVASFLHVINGASRQGIVYLVFGCFYLIYHIAGIWNTLMTAYILHSDTYSTTAREPSVDHVICGAFYCPPQNVNNTKQDIPVTTDTVKLYTFCGVNIILCLLSVLVVILCVSKLNWQPKEDNNGHQREVIETAEKVIGEPSPRKMDCSQLWISSSFYQMANRQQLFLIPLTLYSGLQESFYMYQFSQSYVAYSYGYRTVAMTTVVNAGVTSLSSIVVAQIAGKSGRIPLFVVAALVHCALLLTMFLWHPNTGMVYGHFVVSALWAVGNAVWQSLLHGFYGVLFIDKNPEAAFANHYLWKNLGFMAAFFCNYYLCNYVKIFTLLSVLTAAMLGYFAVEVPLYRQARS